MIDEQTICPYAGLRSFTEEESLYFKGRDYQIEQISELLEKNKFLMVTGASGEGKSSLIYAGLIPNTRAGFFKAQYTNWVIADFRPERSPLANMASAMSTVLNAEKETIATELKRGFSSLVDLYTNSEYWIDEKDSNWNSLTDTQKREKKRKAANLLVIIDQFEEFFTNPENFSNESPSQDSQVVVNLALETARIAVKRNLPIYIVFTMRSDFIGQCVAFRGLPEYIGFSQFFVPRLKRKDFKQVIEEPAILSGNRISQRLIERLVYDIAEGVDQLPVLQHALSQIWLAAKHGTQEMDLIHYAMVGGMPADELPDEDQITFENWFKTLPDFKKKFFEETGLHKIIEFHANTLYESAWEYYSKANPSHPITIKKCKRIIALAFTCLTKIDNSRAVRNRMTLQEITNIINDPEVSVEMVGHVLTIFREEGNSFIRPYKTQDPSTHTLSADAVLDITHEALIRNWNKLNTWAQKEFEYYSTWLDFKKQLHRWIESGKSRGYLLPIGPLTYFEKWFDECKPNVGWISRYLDRDEKKESADQVLANIKEYLKRSSRKVIVTRTFMKYGTQRVATVLAISIMLVLSGFYWNDAQNKRDEKVIERVIASAQALVKSEEVNSNEKATYLIVQERYQKGTLISSLQNLNDPKSRLALAIDVYLNLLLMDNHFNQPVKLELINLIEKEISDLAASKKNDAFLLRQINRYLVRLVYDNYYNPQETFKARAAQLTEILRGLALNFYHDTNRFESAISTEINLALQFWLTIGSPTKSQLDEMLAVLSPFESADNSTFKTYYAKGSYEPDGVLNLDYNGGYHLLASLYAVSGNAKMILPCFDKLREVTDYFTGRLLNNYNNIIGYLYQYNHRDQTRLVLDWLSTNYKNDTPPQDVYRNIMNRSGYLSRMYFINITGNANTLKGYLMFNLCLAPREQFHQMAEDYVEILSKLPNPDDRNFSLALHYKRLAMFDHKYAFDRNIEVDTAGLNKILDKAWHHYNLVSDSYLTKIVTRNTPYWTDGIRHPKISNRHIFIYPDYMDGWFSRTYHTSLFFNYMAKKDLLHPSFINEEDLLYVHRWLANAFLVYPNTEAIKYENFFPLSNETLTKVAELLTSKGTDANLPYLLLAERSFEQGDSASALAYFSKVDMNTINRTSDRFEYLEKSFFLNQLKNVSRSLASIGKYKEAGEIISHFEFPREKAFSYIFNAEALYTKEANPLAFTYLDSAVALFKKEDFTVLRPELDYRFKLVKVLSEVGGTKVNKFAEDIELDFPEGRKFEAIAS
ncbi:MAG TPA: hypothetical protein DGG95_01375, partial [Cytophagales bacterium]|nr:hypothetical protein [Cytophagales bacterium]